MKVISIGKPISNTVIYILDTYLQPTPIGVVGELHIGGEGLARGYLNHPELTAEKFISNPYGEGKIYKTGDLARYLPDGNIEYIGRIDNQVKIRGFRIELGEIEVVLNQQKFIDESVVIVREDEPGDKRLVAYYIPPENQQKNSQELRDFLKVELPEYMIPSVFVELETLPLTPNGKINRRALPKPENFDYQTKDVFVLPGNELEIQLQKIWQKILNVKSISIRDNFFELGGHSLLALQLFNQIKQKIGQDLPLATLFQAPTIEELAHIIQQQGWSSTWSSLVPIQTQGTQTPFFFHGGAADAVTWAKFARSLPSEQPFYALQRPDLDGQAVTLISVEEMARKCLEEIKIIQPQGPYFIGGHCFGGTVAFEIAQQLYAQGEKVALLALIDAYAPISISEDQLNNLWWKTQVQWDKWKFLIIKTYYYHGEKLNSLKLPDKLLYLKDWLLPKIQSKFKIKVNHKSQFKQQSKSQNKPVHQSQSNISKSTSISHEQRYLQAEKMNRQARLQYQPQIYPDALTIFRATTQQAEWLLGSNLGWEHLTKKPIETYKIPGIGGNLFNQNSLPLLVEKVKHYLEKTQNNND